MDELSIREKKEAYREVIEMLNLTREHLPYLAGLYWDTYLALTKQGFTDEQALKILCAKGFNLAG